MKWNVYIEFHQLFKKPNKMEENVFGTSCWWFKPYVIGFKPGNAVNPLPHLDWDRRTFCAHGSQNFKTRKLCHYTQSRGRYFFQLPRKKLPKVCNEIET